jgi:hypothetical protein
MNHLKNVSESLMTNPANTGALISLCSSQLGAPVFLLAAKAQGLV